MDVSDGFALHEHTREQMEIRGVTETQIAAALQTYHSLYPAAALPGRAFRSTVYVGTVDGRDLKVYVEDGTHPPFVRTVAWKGDE